MSVIPNPTFLHHILFYLRVFKDFIILWAVCRFLVYVITIVMLILAIKYAAYLPDNPNYRRNYNDIKVAPSNPFTSPPKTYPRTQE